MPKIHLIIAMVMMLLCSSNSSAKLEFQDFFKDRTLRFDYFHVGNSTQEEITTDKIYCYGQWAGSVNNLIDTFPYGAYRVKIIDVASNTLVYSKGYDSYFKEYQTSNDAIKGIKKTFHETVNIPEPRKIVMLIIEKRDSSQSMNPVFKTTIDPQSIQVIREEPTDDQVKVFKTHESGDPKVKADIVIIGEGYTSSELGKFQEDLNRFSNHFLSQNPMSTLKSAFNISGVYKASAESGVDEPRAGKYKNTLLNASFNALGSERYLLTEDNKTLRDVASHVPYDAIYIMVNHERYGGGGIYNFYCTFTAGNIHSEYLMIHEFGHSFFGLADEYYTSSTAYNDFYKASQEPFEPNITALKDTANLKWKHLLTPGIALPTEWGKTTYDQKDFEWQAKRKKVNDSIAELQKSKASIEAIDAAKKYYDEISLNRAEEVQLHLEKSPFSHKVGAFEGAGYQQYGLYRPSVNCIMFTRADYFCEVCKDAMTKMIEWYVK